MENRIEFLHLCDSDREFAGSPYLRLSTFPQLGMLYLAAVLRRDGYPVAYWDRAYDRMDRPFLASLTARRPLIIGIYSNIALKGDVVELIGAIRETGRDVPIIVGGPAHFEFEEYLRAGASAVVAGQGEEIIKELVDRVASGKSLAGMRGVILPGMKEEDAGLAPMVEDLDALPFPAWDLAPPGRFRNDLAFIQKNPWYVMLASRGCPSRCHFCSQMYPKARKKYRLRSAPLVVEEMSELHRRYGLRHIKFQDDTFGGNRAWLREFCQTLVEKKMPLRWNCSSIPTLFRGNYEETFRLMKQAGCTSLHFGLQSTSQDILEKIGRRADEPRLLAEMVPVMRRLGLYSLVDIIVGLPGETQETIAGHVRYLRKLPTFMIQVFPLNILPNTRLDKDYSDGVVTALSRREIHEGVRRITRKFMLRPSVLGRNMAFILRRNPGYLLTLLKLTPYLFALALGRYRMAAWRSIKQRGRGAPTPTLAGR